MLIPPILYAETHYSFKGIYSRLKKKEPEIIFDIPHRLDPGVQLPILLLIKDSHFFPVYIKDVEILVTQHDRLLLRKTIIIGRKFDSKKYIYEMFYLDLPDDISGHLTIDVSCNIVNQNGTNKNYHNDNYRISSHSPFKIYRSPSRLPKSKGWIYGDLHYHTSYTEDHVEFGAPLLPSLIMFRSMGLEFFAATDHSYDLDDYDHDYLKNDLNLKKWYRFLEEVDTINAEIKDFIIIPGEEVSVGNVRNRNVHLILLNHDTFIPGKGDSAEVWFHNKPDHTIKEILGNVNDDIIAIAAHPEIPAPFLEWLLIRRGQWEPDDYAHDKLTGLQIWNGIDDRNFRRGISRWIKLLLNNNKLYIYAGNDAHGNFNRFRQISFPFWTMRESYNQIAGKVRTGLQINGDFDKINLSESLQAGRCIITNGPFVEFTLSNEDGQHAHIGETLSGRNFLMQIQAISSEEYGFLDHLKIFLGNITNKCELLFKDIPINSGKYDDTINLNIDNLPANAYIRIELDSVRQHTKFSCWTNPIWLVH